MARALADIITEISASYNPLRDRANKTYTSGIEQINPQETADLGGLEQAKKNAFESINTGANRRGMFYSGVPIAEQSKYVGENYLPSIASLKNRYAGIRGNLRQALDQSLAQYDTEAATKGQGIYQQELDRDERIRQFNEQLAAQERAAAAERARAASAGSGGGFYPGYGGSSFSAPAQAPQQTLRQRWQAEAKAGDWNAQVALNYAGDDGRYDGAVNSQDEYNRLKDVGIQGNYYVKNAGGGGGGGGW